ncbi:MAG: hypothetical protein JOZ69_14910 [Myxococcales bacterium]|nr:hypothetical protein [Myxococcales bacterium]
MSTHRPFTIQPGSPVVSDPQRTKIALSEVATLEHLLDEAPVQRAKEVSKRGAIVLRAPKLRDLREARGYTWRDVAAWLTEHGLSVGVPALVQTQGAAAPKAVTPLIDKRTLAHALATSIASIARLCRDQRIPFVLVGEVRRFDLEAVRAALRASVPGPAKVDVDSPPVRTAGPRTEEVPIPGVRLLSRVGRSR